ncbi:MAG: alpha/beta fold hydrolase [Deltaproteobacteria bacterium]
MFATVQGSLTAYRDLGHGPTVVLLHGLGASGESFLEVAEELAPHYRVIAPDLLGNGRTDKPAGDYGAAALARHQAELLSTIGATPVHAVVGHSLGALVAVELCARLRDAGGVRRLCLIDPPPPGGFPIAAFLARLAGGRTSVALGQALLPTKLLARLWLRYLYADPKRLRPEVLDRYAELAAVRGSAAATVASLAAMGKLRLPTDVAPPTLLLWGEEDPVFPPSGAADWQERLRSSELLVLPACGHCAPEEAPRAVARGLLDFLAAEPPARAARVH